MLPSGNLGYCPVTFWSEVAMARSSTRHRLILIAAVLSVVLVSVGAGTAVASTAPATGPRAVDITAADGVVLKAHVFEPGTPGRHPAIVFVNSWGLDDREYLLQARGLAERGYVVLSYTTRGFWASGGRIETAGPLDVADASTALDWLLAHTSADPGRLGMAGVSYGSGICLIATAFDPRIKAVVAMSTWTDLVASLYGDQTRRPQAVFLLAALANLVGRPSAELSRVIDDYFANRNTEQNASFGRLRSAASYVDAINRNHPAILLANAYGDSLFPPNQLVDFFGRLTGPKRLELAAGDHAVVEAAGLVGLPNHAWTSRDRCRTARGTAGTQHRCRGHGGRLAVGERVRQPARARRGAVVGRYGSAGRRRDGRLVAHDLDRPGHHRWRRRCLAEQRVRGAVGRTADGLAAVGGPAARRSLGRSAAALGGPCSGHRPAAPRPAPGQRQRHGRGLPLRPGRHRDRCARHARAGHLAGRRARCAAHAGRRAVGDGVRRTGRPPARARGGHRRPALPRREPVRRRRHLHRTVLVGRSNGVIRNVRSA